jgi:nucleotide-binding universal stress UspA family protein
VGRYQHAHENRSPGREGDPASMIATGSFARGFLHEFAGPGESPDRRARILLASNGSPVSRRATVVAADLASATGAELHIVHVMPPREWRTGRLAATRAITQRLPDAHTSTVLLDARKLAWAHGAAAQTVLLAGETPAAITELAVQLRPRLLVIGAGRHRAPALIASPTRHALEHHPPCEILTVQSREVAATIRLLARGQLADGGHAH